MHDLRDRSVTPQIAIDGHLSKTGKRRKTAVMDAQPAMLATTSATAAASGSRRCSAGSRVPAGLAKVKLRGGDRVDATFALALAAYNLIRLHKLLSTAA